MPPRRTRETVQLGSGSAGQESWPLEPRTAIFGAGVNSDPEIVFTQPERAFEREVIRYAESMGWLIHKDRATNAPRICKHCKKPLKIPRNDPGFPDLVMVRAGRVVWAELKSARGKPTKDQLCWLRALWAAGEECFVWKPEDWETIAQVLR